jgi:RNase P subunit RPR2
MKVTSCPNCKTELLLENAITHVLIEQGNIRIGNQNGIEVNPVTCANCGLVMLFKKE